MAERNVPQGHNSCPVVDTRRAYYPVPAAIAAHRTAYDAFQVAPEAGDLADEWDADTEAAVAAEEAYHAAGDALVATVCDDPADAPALLAHLRWWLADEAENAASLQPAYGIARARARDLALFLDAADPLRRRA